MFVSPRVRSPAPTSTGSYASSCVIERVPGAQVARSAGWVTVAVEGTAETLVRWVLNRLPQSSSGGQPPSSPAA